MDAASATSGGGGTSKPPPFLSKTYEMVDDPATDSIVSWSTGNDSFVVWNVPDFARDLLPKYFKHKNFSSFVRQLNTYGFRKVDPDRFEFANEGFLRGQKHLLKSICRRRPANPHTQAASQEMPVESSSVGAHVVEVGKFGLEEEVERLKRDKNVLMQELVRLRQQQQATDNQLAGVGQRVQVMEQRQQQMMSFLAKAMQSPGFFSQFVQQQNESNRRIGDVNKKRRLSREEENDSPVHSDTSSSNGRIVKYQPSLNETAKAVLRQILKMNVPPRLELSIDNSDDFLIDNNFSSTLDSRSSSNVTSGLTLAEVLPTSVQSKSSANSGFSASHPAGMSDSQSSSHAMKHEKPAKQMAERKFASSQELTAFSSGEAVGVLMPEVTVEIPEPNFVISDAANTEYINSLSASLNSPIDMESDLFSPEHCVDNLLDDVPKLQAINDTFWEQFLVASPLTAEMDEISSTSQETGVAKETECGQERGPNRTHFMDCLTEQMGLLSSSGRTV